MSFYSDPKYAERHVLGPPKSGGPLLWSLCENMKNTILNKGSVGILVGIAGVVVALFSIKISVDIATRSGNFEKGELVARIARLDVGEKSVPINIVFGVDLQKTKNDIVIGHFPLTLFNTGKKSINEVTVTYQYHEIYRRHAFEHMDFITAGAFESKELDRSFSKIGTQHYASYRLPHLAPGMSFGLNDPIGLQKTEFTEVIPLSDGALLPVTFKYGLTFDILITAKDLPRIKTAIKLHVIDAKNKYDLMDKFKKDFAYSEAEKLRTNSSFVEYLGHILFNRETKNAVLIYPNLRKVEANKVVLYDSTLTDESVTTASYEIVNVDLLWN